MKTTKTETQFYKLLNKYFVKMCVNIAIYINPYKYINVVLHIYNFVSTHGPF